MNTESNFLKLSKYLRNEIKNKLKPTFSNKKEFTQEYFYLIIGLN